MNPELSESNKITTLVDFLKWTQRLKPGEYLFRGVSNVDYKIEASAYRCPSPTRDESFGRFLQINQDLIKDARLQGLGIRDGRKLEDLEILAELQHSGAATCLIDFTYSALIALWFACSSESPDIKTDGKVFAVSDKPSNFTEITPQLLKEDIDFFLTDQADDASGELYQWRPWQLNNRIGAQQSIFLFGRFKIDPDQECTVDKDSKHILRMQLQQIGNITEAILFPDLDGFARLQGHKVPYGQPPNSEYIHEYRILAGSAYNKREYSEAIDSWNYVIRLDLSNTEDYFQRGLARYNLEQYEEAIADFGEAIQLSLNDANAYYQRGLAKYALNRYKEAIADFDKVIQLSLNDANAYYQRGLAKYALNRYKEAIADFGEAIDLAPDDVETYYQRGMGHCNLEQYEKAITDFDKVIAFNENYRQAYYNRGQAKYHLKKFNESKKDVQMALQKAEEAGDIDLIDRIREFIRICPRLEAPQC